MGSADEALSSVPHCSISQQVNKLFWKLGDLPAVSGGMDVCTILNLDSLGLTLRQAPKLLLDIVLCHWDSAKHPM